MKTVRNFKAVLLLTTIVTLLATNLVKAQTYSFKCEVSGQGEAVILIPGMTCPGEVWQETVAMLQKHYQCHVLTLPGFAGHTALDSVPDDYLGLIRDEIFRYIDEQNLSKVHLIGHSLGGFLSLDLASRQPDSFGKILVVDGLPFLGGMMDPSMTEEKAKPMAENMKQMSLQQGSSQSQYNRQMLKMMITAEEDIDTAIQWGLKSDPRTVAQAMYNLYTTDLRDDIAAIQSPVLVLGAWVAYQDYGATRESTSQIYHAQYHQLNGYRLEMTDRGRHFIMWDDKPFFFAQLQDFFGLPATNVSQN
ncbi:MAG: alpha/beta fold hydrolase [Cyclobacteriaceae bacterium]